MIGLKSRIALDHALGSRRLFLRPPLMVRVRRWFRRTFMRLPTL